MSKNLKLKPNDNILFIGDSITDSGRTSPAYFPYGNGYVFFLANWLMAKYAELDLKIFNTGISGNTVTDLKQRWDRDCIEYDADIVSILIGVNDANHCFGPQAGSQEAGRDYYKRTYRELLEDSKKKTNSQLVMLEPFLLCDDENNQLLRMVRSYVEVVDRLAEEFDALLVPLQRYVDESIKRIATEKWSEDMVHPFTWAHAWIAQRWLGATGL